MSKAEILFKQRLNTWCSDAYILKVPDFKQTGSGALRGMPDFLVIRNGVHYWYEVKYTKSLKTFNLNGINQYQWIVLNKMLLAGVDVQIVIYDRNFEYHATYFSAILNARNSGKKHIDL